mgnify:CR=1 FL=1
MEEKPEIKLICEDGFVPEVTNELSAKFLQRVRPDTAADEDIELQMAQDFVDAMLVLASIEQFMVSQKPADPVH